MTLYIFSLVYCAILVTSFGYVMSSHFFILYICLIISSFLYWVPWEDSPSDYMGTRNHYCIMFVCCEINKLKHKLPTWASAAVTGTFHTLLTVVLRLHRTLPDSADLPPGLYSYAMIPFHKRHIRWTI